MTERVIKQMINDGAALEISQVSSIKNSPRVAWLLQGAGAYYQPIMSEFTRLFPQTRVFTADWPGFLPGFEDSFAVKQVGSIKVLSIPGTSKTYKPSFTYLSPRVVAPLFEFHPDIVFSTGFSIWTILALLLKVWCRWRVVVLYDGSSPGVDYQKSWLRLSQRRLIARIADAFVTNNRIGKTYLTEILGASADKVFARPYLVPHPKTYSQNSENLDLAELQLQHPVFLFVGHLIPRKGLHELLQACSLLEERGYRDYSLLVVGDGSQRLELEEFVKTHNLGKQVKWVGAVKYERVGAYFQLADVFVFPTIEDVWGLVAVEAMIFGKPILCSKWAGAVELVVDGENGYAFDPRNPEQLAQLMSRFIDRVDAIEPMGEKSKQIMTNHTPEAVSKHLAEIVEFVLNKR
ncbi:glycosyltransferase family 4 protein [Pleurocapsa sp. PCC 7327]|uniref:glycosyltransferase family 4 protein n=1 Tax=Pleurocapsa sp. PCC 7327 TaxID=118163 RepID=UPI0020C80FC6|nr:glycosyltransferase family 4 protein [Pleurocapsa sp. PCC 7327]